MVMDYMDHYYMLDLNIQVDNYNHHTVLHWFEYMYLQIELNNKSFIIKTLPPFKQGNAAQKSVESHRGPANPVLHIHLLATQTPLNK
jgi:hypothetical protein